MILVVIKMEEGVSLILFLVHYFGCVKEYIENIKETKFPWHTFFLNFFCKNGFEPYKSNTSSLKKTFFLNFFSKNGFESYKTIQAH